MRNATVCFLLRADQICLGMKKRGFGQGKWNGFGGKIGDREEIKNETPEEAVEREGVEEFAITVKQLEKVAENRFNFPHNPDWDQFVYVFMCKEWWGEPMESEELRPQWFKLSEIPYDTMWSDDRIWLPQVLAGNKLFGHFIFDDKENITKHEVKITK